MKIDALSGLILPGGGARGAYQVGVLKALADLVDSETVPFQAISGISAGAINATALAQNADNFASAVDRLERIWTSMSPDDVFTMDYGLLQRFTARTGKPRSLFENSPLVELLERELSGPERVARQLEEGNLRGLAVTASNYSTAQATTFFQSKLDTLNWNERRRDSVRTEIGVPHVLASAALPLLFPAQRVGDEFFVDGALRMTEPLRPVIKMGAERILIIGVRNETLPLDEEQGFEPGIAEIAGYTLDSLFAENLNADIERMEQVNRLLDQMGWWGRRRSEFRRVRVMVVRPSQDLRVIAQRFASELPRGIRMFLRTIGGWGHEWRLPSFLLFHGAFARELIDLGYRDGLRQRPQVEAFFRDP